jgi:hypothetical protein
MVEDPLTDEERRSVAEKFVGDLNLPMPALLDGVDDAVSRAYASHPDRLYLIGKDGRVAYAGERGPIGFKPALMREAIEDELVRIEVTSSQAVRKTESKKSLRQLLDADSDGELSSEEIRRAAEVLGALDRNGDGKLSEHELPPVKSPMR